MKKSIWSIVIVVLVVAVVGSMLGVSLAFADEGKAEVEHSRTVRLAQMSDIHVMIEEWCNPYSQSYASGSIASGKMLGETQELTRTALDDIYAQAIAGDAPMYVFLTGDLTSNGELANTMWVASVLKEYTAKIRAIEGYEGFQFFAIPGNHDIYNQKAGSFMPNPDNADEYAEFWGMSAEQKQAYLASLKKTGVRTTTNLEFVTLFSDFGYCNCPLRKEGKHLPTCGMADGCELEFFYESPFWYDDDTVLSETPVLLDEPLVLVGEELDPEHRYVYDREYKVLSGGGLNAWTLEQGGADMAQAVEDYNASDKDFRITAQYSRHGACSYIARLNGVTVVGFDGDSRRFKALKEDETNMAMLSSDGWDETTGGIILNNMLKWAFDSLATHRDAEQGNLVVCLGHINILPHFDTEDEVISLFTYDNWEQVASNLADHGIRYTFTGHQHAMDIENFVSQSGNILYDFETGSMASMGSGWRDLAIKQTWYTDGAYSEDVASHVNFTDFNDKLDGVDVFRYKLPRVQADGSVAMSTEYEMDGDSYVGIDVALGKGLRNMLGNMIKGYVNDGLYDRIRSMTAGLAGGSMDGVYQLLNDLIDQLADMDFVPFIPNADGTEFTMADAPQAGYGLIDFAEDFVDYILKFDFSYGKSQGGLTLGDLLWQVYGAHLVGAHGDYIADNLLPMLNALDNGDFVRMIEDLIYRGVMPQLEVLLNAPIYWGDVEYVRVDEDAAPVTKADVANGKGFDLSENGASLLELKFANGMIDVGNIIKKYADISSLRNLIRSLPRILRGIGLIDDNGGVKTSGIMLDVINGLVGRDISKYLGIASDYLDKIDRYPTITLMIKAELLDKYVTTAFCKNLGNYGRYVLESMIRDDSPDGIGWDQAKLQAGSLFPFVVLSTEDSVAFKRGFFNVTPAPLDATNFTVDGVVHTYYRLSDGSDALTVVPTKANGMVPSMITMTNVVGSDGKLDTTQKALRWWTHFDVDVTDVDEDDLSNQKHETFIQWGDAADRLYTQIAVAGDNIRIEYPTMDLGMT